MKKLLLLLLVCYQATAFGQLTVLPKIAKDYFRSSPFNREFGDFLQHLINDPTLEGKKMQHRTDTSLFSFSGTYKTHNPFFFIKATNVQVNLSEELYPHPTASKGNDTLIQYMLIASLPNTDAAKKLMEKEIVKIKKRYQKSFGEMQTTGISNGTIYNYFIGEFQMSPFAISQQVVGNEQKLILILRMKQDGNITWIPW